ncbi:hypothetical protein EEL32_00290 (plasmid) [Brevibacillus laterosporus]|nr:hypothetical protein [Brevibacillus laterosporus]TPG93529.1 hypothetical protein EEL32_00290 [Brevibacillus laterosporus]
MSREIDAKVAECLGWKDKGLYWYDPQEDYHYDKELFSFSSSGEGMLLLMEKAAEESIYICVCHVTDGFWCQAEWKNKKRKLMSTGVSHYKEGPEGAALSYLKAKGVDITPYLVCSQ